MAKMTHQQLASLVADVLNWRFERECCEMIECPGYHRTHYSDHGGITCDELDTVCEAVNRSLTLIGSNYRVSWAAGEFLPGVAR